MPSFLNVIRTADANFREYLFQQLAVLINIVGQHVRNYLDDIFLLIKVSILLSINFLIFDFEQYDTYLIYFLGIMDPK